VTVAPPRDAVGLDIGTTAVRAARVALGKGPPTLAGFGQISLPRGTVRDGEIADPDVVAQAIRELWKRAPLKRRNVALGIANQKVVVRPVELPLMAEEELRGAIQYQVQEFIPIPVEDAVLDFQILEETTGEDGARMMRVLLVAAQKEMVNRFVDTVVRAGLDPEAVDLIPFALIRSLSGTGGTVAGSNTGEAIVDVGAGVTNIVVHEQGIPRFVRILLVGGNAISEALAAGLAIPFEDAERRKQETGLPGDPDDAEGRSTADPAVGIIEERATDLVNEIRGSLDFYLAQAEATPIVRVVLSGGGSRLTNLSRRLAAALRLPVEQGRTLEKVKPDKLKLSEAQLVQAEPLMAAAAGLALGAEDE
jgi:type IV pilus assembly protein PilM